MRIADWPVERIRLLWILVMVYLAALILFTVTRGNHQDGGQQGVTQFWGSELDRPLTPGEQARGDSLMDSMRIVLWTRTLIARK
jgi:hypothetical protein